MKKHSRSLAVLSMLLVFALLLGACSKAAQTSTGSGTSAPAISEASPEAPVELDTARTISVLEFSGKVTVKSNEQDVAAFQGMRLRQGDVVTTDAGAVAYLDLDSDKLITLDESSSISLDVITGDEQNQKTALTLLAGTACSSISSLSGTSSYDIKTANFTMGVRGTIFVAALDPQTNNPEVSVVEGKVEAKPDTASEDGMFIGAQQSASPTPELWKAFLANPATPVTHPLDVATLSTPILGSILMELEHRAETLPGKKAELQKIAEAIKAARPDAATAAEDLKAKLGKASEALNQAVAPVAEAAAPAVTPPPAAPAPVPPAASSSSKADDSSTQDENREESNRDDLNNSSSDNSKSSSSSSDSSSSSSSSSDGSDGNGSDGNGNTTPPTPPVPTPKLKTPEVTIQSFTKDGISISFAPIKDATSYAISVSGLGNHSIYNCNLPAPSGTDIITFAHTFDTPLAHSGLYALRVTANASNAANNSNAFTQTCLIDVANQVFEVTAANLDYHSTSFDITSYPQGADSYDVLVRSGSNKHDVYLTSTSNIHAHFESELDTIIEEPGKYELVITPKNTGGGNKTFASYTHKVTMTQLSAPSLADFSLPGDATRLHIGANLAEYPIQTAPGAIEVEFFKDNQKIEPDSNWSITIDRTTVPQNFVLTYAPGGVETPIPTGAYRARIRTTSTGGNSIPSAWVDTNMPIYCS